MSYFLNVIYNGLAAVVKIPNGFTTHDLHDAVKGKFKIHNKIRFQDNKTAVDICDEEIVDYTLQFIKSPGWTLEAIDAEDLEEELNLDSSEPSNFIEEFLVPSQVLKSTENSITYDIHDYVVVSADELGPSTSQSAQHYRCHNSDTFCRYGLQPYVRMTLTVEKLLNLKTIDFRIIQAHYQKNNVISAADKIRLSKIVINHLFEENLNLELNRQDFVYIADIICQVFKCELADEYYTRATSGQKPSGKLYNCYSNYRRSLCSAGLIQRRILKPRNLAASIVNIEDELQKDDIVFLRNNKKSFDTIIEKWKKCYTERSKILSDKAISTSEYLSNFLIFSTNDVAVFKLFYEDTKILHPDVCNNLTCIYKNILNKGERLKDRNVQKWIHDSRNCSDSVKKALSLLLLPYFFPSTKIKSKPDKQSFKATKIEIQEKFILYFETLSQADNYERDIARRNCGLQPRIVFIGPFHDLQAYVTLVDKKYNYGDPLKAVEQCFYAYQALDIEYRPESTAVWTFVQVTIERAFSTLKRVLTDYRNRLSEETLENILLVKLNPNFLNAAVENLPLFEDQDDDD